MHGWCAVFYLFCGQFRHSRRHLRCPLRRTQRYECNRGEHLDTRNALPYGQLLRIIAPPGRVSQYGRDAHGQLTESTRPKASPPK
ncbi:MAG: hypothetical protein CFE38_00370 [Comamonadaceae bacterium PBBC1]|nr:MAG: hypothetical protein CFE38_00370 [Comamonadaceae bacterium PBBC1]